MKVLYIYADGPAEWNSSNWRCRIPAMALLGSRTHRAQLIHQKEFAAQTPMAQSLCEWADALILERMILPEAMKPGLLWRERGKLLIGDFDDAYQLLEESNISHAFWHLGEVRNEQGKVGYLKPAPIEMFRRCLGHLDGFFTPNRQLVKDFEVHGRGAYLPNFLDGSRYTFRPGTRHPQVVIGWGGSSSHVRSWQGSGLLVALRTLFQRYPQVVFMVNGGDVRILPMFKLPTERVIVRPWVGFDQWPSELAQYDIGLAPLAGEYDQRRSWIKPLEYMAMGIPWVASESIPYEDLAPYGRLVKNTTEAWLEALSEVVEARLSGREEVEPGIDFARSCIAEANVDRIVASIEAFRP